MRSYLLFCNTLYLTNPPASFISTIPATMSQIDTSCAMTTSYLPAAKNAKSKATDPVFLSIAFASDNSPTIS